METTDSPEGLDLFRQARELFQFAPEQALFVLRDAVARQPQLLEEAANDFATVDRLFLHEIAWRSSQRRSGASLAYVRSTLATIG